MLKTRLLVLGLLAAAPACNLPYPYPAQASGQQGDAWATNSRDGGNSTATATTPNGTVVVLVVDQDALEELTREAARQGRTVVQLRVSSDGHINTKDTGEVRENRQLDRRDYENVVRGYGSSAKRDEDVAALASPKVNQPVVNPPNVVEERPESNSVTQNRTSTVAVTAPQKPVVAEAPQVHSTPRRFGFAPVARNSRPVVETPSVSNKPVVTTQKPSVSSTPSARSTPSTSQLPVVAATPVASTPPAKGNTGVTAPRNQEPSVSEVPVVSSVPVVTPSRPTTTVLRKTGPGTANGYSAYGTVSGSNSMRHVGWNTGSANKSLGMPSPFHSSQNVTTGNGSTTTTSSKKRGTGYWGLQK